MVFENFGELIVQAVLLFRFQWLVNKEDFSTLGFSFQVYVTSVMGLSFFTMLSALMKYNNRGRKSMRKMFSLQTASTLLLWITLLAMKVTIYVIGFMNSPGLFWVPMFLKICLLWLVLSCTCSCTCSRCCKPFEAFRSLLPHDKFVYLLVSCLVPVSIPSQETKSTKRLYMVSVILFFFECFLVLVYALLIKHFYHFHKFRQFYEEVLPGMLGCDTFELLIVICTAALLLATLVSALLLCLVSKCCHAKSNLFPTTSAAVPEHVADDSIAEATPMIEEIEMNDM